MALMIISSGDGRALAIRDHLLPLIRERGSLEIQRDTVRLTSLQVGVWLLQHWTLFNEPAAEEASSPGYRHAVARQRTREDLAYGLEVRRNGVKVLRVLWAESGASEVLDFVRGAWEQEAMAL